MTGEAYGTLAAVYEWLVPELMLTPEGSVAAFSDPVGALDPARGCWTARRARASSPSVLR